METFGFARAKPRYFWNAILRLSTGPRKLIKIINLKLEKCFCSNLIFFVQLSHVSDPRKSILQSPSGHNCDLLYTTSLILAGQLTYQPRFLMVPKFISVHPTRLHFSKLTEYESSARISSGSSPRLCFAADIVAEVEADVDWLHAVSRLQWLNVNRGAANLVFSMPDLVWAHDHAVGKAFYIILAVLRYFGIFTFIRID